MDRPRNRRRSNTVSMLKAMAVRVDALAYPLFMVPIVSFLPSPIAYGFAVMRGDALCNLDDARRRKVITGIGSVRRDLSQAEAVKMAREYFRLKSCDLIDSMRLLGSGRVFTRLIDIDGLEALRKALLEGKGVILCSAHFGSVRNAFSGLGATGVRVTMVGRWSSTDDATHWPIAKLMHRLIRGRPVSLHYSRPAIVNRAGDAGAALEVASALRDNEAVGILIDSLVKSKDLSRPLNVSFLGRGYKMAAGATTIAKLTGAPLLLMLVYRKSDYRHQVAKIAGPISVVGDPEEIFVRLLRLVEQAILSNPAHYVWDELT